MPSRDPATRLVGFLRDPASGGELSPAVTGLAEDLRILSDLGRRLTRTRGDSIPEGLAVHLSGRGADVSPDAAAEVAYRLAQRRARDLSDQLAAVCAHLDAAGITAIPLKGAALLEHGDADGRTMTDLDVLICPAARVGDAHAVLVSLGYRDASAQEYQSVTVLPDQHQLTPLVKDGRAGSIELHRSVLQSEFDPLLPEHLLLANLADTPSGPRFTPFLSCLHAIIHALIVDNQYRLLVPPLRAALDVQRLRNQDAQVLDRLREHAARADPEVRRAIAAVLLVVDDLDGSRGRHGAQARWWWWRVRTLSAHPGLRRALGGGAMASFALRRERMEARVGHPLGPVRLLWARCVFLVQRTRQFLSSGR